MQAFNVLLETALYKKAIKNTDIKPETGIKTEVYAIRRGLLDNFVEKCFKNITQVGISLKGVPTVIKLKKKKKHDKDEFKLGFVLKEAPIGSFLLPSGPRGAMSSSAPLHISAKLFSMPLGSALIADPLSVSGVTTSLLESYNMRYAADFR